MPTYIEQFRRLRELKEVNGSSNIAVVKQDHRELSEVGELSPRVELCHTCTCDEYVIRLQGGCSVCNGGLCAKCGGCLKSSHAWRHEKRDHLIQPDAPLEVVLGRLRRGHSWLQEQQDLLFEDAEKVNLDTYTKGLDEWEGLEATARRVHGYEGCVLGENNRCPEDSQPTCWSCVSNK